MLEGARQYEISFLALREGDKDAVQAAILGAQGEIVSEGRYAEIKLAYPVKKQTSAFFGSLVFSAAPEKAVEVEKTLKFSEGILRVLIITPPPRKPIRNYQPKPVESVVSEAKEADLIEEPSVVAREEAPSGKVNEADFNEKLQEILG